MAADSIAFAKPEDVGVSRAGLAAMQDALTREIETARLPGAVTLVARRGRIVHFKALGLSDPRAGTAMELDAIFRIYSMTKPIVSVAIMQLVEEGRLRLADPVQAFLPAFADTRVVDGAGVYEPPGHPMTIHDLLRHTSGLTYEFLGPPWVAQAYLDARVGRGNQTNAQQMSVLAGLPLAAHPGTRWDYGRSTDVLGHIVELVTGLSLQAALTERVFGPLAMVDTDFRLPREKRPRLAQPFDIDPDDGSAVEVSDLDRDVVLENGGGGLVSSAADYARFLHMLWAGGTFEGTRLLGRKTIAYMASDHLAPGMPRGSDLLPPGYGFGLGFAVRTGAGHAPFPGSTGDYYWGGLAGTTFWIDPAEDLYALLMIQAPNQRDYYRSVFRSLVYATLDD